MQEKITRFYCLGLLALLVALFLACNPLAARPAFASSSSTGKKIVVSISKQWMFVYQNGVEVYNSPITTARPTLGEPTGTFHVFAKLHPTIFTSPWPPGSPNWYPPTHIQYALEWANGFFLHDAWWRTIYGPGTNVWYHDPDYGWQTGTHGCIAMPLSAVIWLYHWAPIGTTVQIKP